MRPFTTLVKVKVQILDTYGVIVNSPKQFDVDRSKVKVPEMAHWALKVRSSQKLSICFLYRHMLYPISWYANFSEQRNDVTKIHQYLVVPYYTAMMLYTYLNTHSWFIYLSLYLLLYLP